MEYWMQQLIAILPDGAVYFTLIALVAFLESIPLLGLAMPGSTLIVLAGFLAAQGKGDMTNLILFSASGAFLGDFVSYWLGGRLGKRLLITPWLLKRQQKLQEAEAFFVEHGGKSLFYARFLGPIRGTIPFLAGMARMRAAFFCRTSLLNAILWGIAYPGLGYLGGESWQRAGDLTSRLGLIILLAFAASLFHIWLKRKTR
jgi:undecaprenyl-diphosphatase